MTTIKFAAVFAVTVAALALPWAASAETGTGSLTPIYTVPEHVDGAAPTAPMVRVGARLFGTTQVGGAARCGTVFSVDPKTGRYAVVYSFTCMGDGSLPYAGLAVMGGKLYGTTSQGGPSNGGTVFEIDPATGVEKTVAGLFSVHSSVSAPLLGFHGKLYGTAFTGGDIRGGSVFSVDPASGTVTILSSFHGYPDGSFPNGALIQYAGKLYGTTANGGKHNAGTIYRVEPLSAGSNTCCIPSPTATTEVIQILA